MRSNPQLRLIPLSEIERLKKAGYEPLASGDASQANSDYFMIMVNRKAASTDIMIVCPTFLRGPLTIDDGGSFGY